MGVIYYVGLSFNITAALGILLYRRNGARFKRHVSLFAYFILSILIFDIFRYTTSIGGQYPISPVEVLWQSILCMFIIRSGGNISYLFPGVLYEAK